MNLADLRRELDEEVGTILADNFSIEVAAARNVPQASDPGITYPNLDERKQKAKTIETCVLYIDIRKST